MREGVVYPLRVKCDTCHVPAKKDCVRIQGPRKGESLERPHHQRVLKAAKRAQLVTCPTCGGHGRVKR